MFDNIQKYWKIWSAVAIGVVGVITWVVNLEPRIPDTVEEMIEIREAVQAMPTEAQTAVKAANDAHAIEIRQMRYEDAKRKDSIFMERDKIKDSLTLDAFKRFTVQIEQLEEKIDKHNN